MGPRLTAYVLIVFAGSAGIELSAQESGRIPLQDADTPAVALPDMEWASRAILYSYQGSNSGGGGGDQQPVNEAEGLAISISIFCPPFEQAQADLQQAREDLSILQFNYDQINQRISDARAAGTEIPPETFDRSDRFFGRISETQTTILILEGNLMLYELDCDDLRTRLAALQAIERQQEYDPATPNPTAPPEDARQVVDLQALRRAHEALLTTLAAAVSDGDLATAAVADLLGPASGYTPYVPPSTYLDPGPEAETIYSPDGPQAPAITRPTD